MAARYIYAVFLLSVVFASTDIEHQIEQLTKSLEKLQNDYTVMKDENELIRRENVELRNTVSKLAKKVDQYDINTVAFTAHSGADAVYDVGATIQFGSVQVSYGGGFDPSTSIFTVPVSGLYTFMTTVTINLHQHFTGALMHNGNQAGRMEANTHYNENQLGQSGLSEVLNCIEGDQVYIMVNYTDAGQTGVIGSSSSIFSGHLLEFYVEA